MVPVSRRIPARGIRGVVALLAVLALGACANPLGGRSDTSRQWLRWRDQRITDYTFRYARQCFCQDYGTLVVEVRDGVVTHVHSEQGIPVAQPDVHVPTVDELFARIIVAEREGTHTDVDYHDSRAYPTDATIGTLENDAGVRHVISDLRRID
ncbi:MAG TPA: DUF6174 domain-containing protein [Longimicrobium sp.]|nr:DUF6174 domain-containing protein [Longimicrobium sp.]